MSERVPTVLVTDASRGSALAIIRSLGRRGWRVVAADEEPSSPGFHSRYAQEQLVYPSPRKAADEFVEVVAAAARGMAVDLVIPVTDDAILPLSRGRGRFEGLCKLAIPQAAALEVTTDKLETLALARRLDVPAPRTHLVREPDEAIEYARRVGWPVVLKPRASRTYAGGVVRGGFRVEYAGSVDELSASLKALEERRDVLLQEYLPGTGHGVELLLDRGRPLAAFQHERLREVPVHGGASALRRSVPLDPVLHEQSVRLLEALEWTGLAMVEFKLGPRGARLMEINGRVWGSIPLAVQSGIDFPARLADLLLRGPPEAPGPTTTDYRVGVVGRNLELDLLWIGSVLRGRRRHPCLELPPRRRAIWALFELLNPTYEFDVLSLDDLAPGLWEIAKIARKLTGKLFGT